MKYAMSAMALAVILSGCADARHNDDLTSFERQSIDWHDCRTGPDDETGRRLAAAGALCGEYSVPLDYTRPDGPTISVAVARRAATDAAHRLGTLLVDLGGPEPSRDGVAFVAQGLPGLAEHGSDPLSSRYDLVGIDPRFFGLSAPLECGWPTAPYLRGMLPDDDSPAAFDRTVAVAKDLASRCAPQRDVLPYASTRNIARDLDVLRSVLGEDTLSYLGLSYGSYLGAVYVQLFSEHAGRVVLDSVVAPDAAGPAMTRNTATADAAALADWAAWEAEHNNEYGLDTVRTIVAAAAAHPLRVGSYDVDAALVPALLLTVDDSAATYRELSAQLGILLAAARGASVQPTNAMEQRLALYANPDVIPELGASASVANQCADRAASSDPQTYYDDIRTYAATEPLFGPIARHITPCAFWPTAPAEPPTTFDTDHAVLILSASGDPVLPYSGQQAMHRALTGSRMVTLDNAFRHGVYRIDEQGCVREAVDRYLLDGVLPAADVTCDGGP